MARPFVRSHLELLGLFLGVYKGVFCRLIRKAPLCKCGGKVDTEIGVSRHKANRMADWHSQLSATKNVVVSSHVHKGDCCHEPGKSSDYSEQPTVEVEKNSLQSAQDKLIRQCLDDAADGKVSTLTQAIVSGQLDINFKDTTGYCALHLSVWHNDLKSVNLLLNDAISPVDQRASNGFTPLMCAAQKGNLPLIKLFLDRGADIEARDSNGITPVILAAQYGQIRSFIVLKHRGADAHAVDINGCTVAHWAAFHNFSGFLLMLKAFNVPLDSTDNSGYTPLHRASSSNAVDSLAYLLRIDSDRTAKSLQGKTPQQVGQEAGLVGAQMAFITHSTQSKAFATSFKVAFTVAWVVVYLNYIASVLPFTAHCFYSSLAFNLCMLILPISSLLTLLSQSGELSRQSDSPDVGLIASIGEQFEAGNFADIPDAGQICFTCFLKRPQRSKHCQICDRCIPRQDHHCQFIGKCISERNLRRFVLTLSLTYFSVVLFLYLELQLFSAHIQDTAMSAVVAQTVLQIIETADFNVFVALTAVPVAWYSGWYLYLEVLAVSQGLTVNEVLNRHRYRYLFTNVEHKVKGNIMRFTNPFTRGFFMNWVDFLSS
jgi:palmitoyltransferase